MKFYRYYDSKEKEFISCIEENGRLLEVEDPFSNNGEIIKTGKLIDSTFLSLVSPTEPTKAICVGLNYKKHADETNYSYPEIPVIFMKPSSAVLDPDGKITWPEFAGRVDYEAELAVVIKDYCYNLNEDEVESHIFGYTCANDVTSRTLQPHDGQWTISKSFDTFLPLGPCVETELDAQNTKVRLILNGKIKQEENTNRMIFSIPFLVSYISKVMSLYPGDVILTGTPEGISPLNDGDTVEVEIDGIGILRNEVELNWKK